MFAWKFYHGTSKAAYESIRQTGFVLGKHSFHRWLGTRGIYLVCNRPLVAMKFAERTAMRDGSLPVVLEVPIHLPKPEHTVNLMTDEGMNLFWESYEANYTLLAKSKLGSDTPKEYAEYFQAIKIKDVQIRDLLEEAFKGYDAAPTEVNWDTLATATMEVVLKVCMVIAAIQEGTTFNLLFAPAEPSWEKTKSYRGTRVRDHIEICLLDTSYIENDAIQLLDNPGNNPSYNRRFVSTVVNPMIPDA